MKTDHEVIIIGTGFAGIGMGIRLKQAGLEDFVILEKDDGVGGTWRANRYPGAACDVQSHLYSFSFEPNPRWTRMFAPQAEILAYLERCADKYRLRPHIRCQREVERARYDEAGGFWQVTLTGGEALTARFLVLGTGGLSRPSYPAIAGLERFRGALFHTARWNHDYALREKRVAVIGTGASAIQVVPAIVEQVGQLKLFQRTPPWVLAKPDREIGPREQRLYARYPRLQRLQRRRLYWSLEVRSLGFVVAPKIMDYVQHDAERYLEECVRDPALRAKLTPQYRFGCKRVLLSNDYYQALEKPNLELVTDGIAEVRERGVVTKDGRVHEVDALVFATGFQAAEAVAPFPIAGRGGLELDAQWRDGAEAYLGSTVAGFPNLFVLVGPNTGLGHSSMVFMIESAVKYALEGIKLARARGLRALEVRRDVQDRFNRALQERMTKTVWATGGCTSWYMTASGKNTTLWPSFTYDYRLRTRRFDAENYTLIAGEEAAPSMQAALLETQTAS